MGIALLFANTQEIRNTTFCKEALLVFFWGPKQVYVIQYIKDEMLVKSVHYAEPLKHAKRRVSRVKKPTRLKLLQHDNAPPQTSRATAEALLNLKFKPVP